MKHDRAEAHRLLGALGLTLALYFLFCISGRLYTFTDSITVGVVTGGCTGKTSCVDGAPLDSGGYGQDQHADPGADRGGWQPERLPVHEAGADMGAAGDEAPGHLYL